MIALNRKSVSIARDLRLEYVEHGDRAGTPVILLHGYTDSWHSFELALPHFPRDIRALALSQRGHGNSSQPTFGYDPSDYAADVAAFMDALDIERAVIVGHSLGASIAQRFAARYQARTLGLVLVGAFMSFHDNAAVRELWEQGVSQLTDPVDPAFVRDFQMSAHYRAVPKEFLELVVRESLKLPAGVWRAVLQQFMTADFSIDQRRITAPTSIVWGDQDGFASRADQVALSAAITGSRLALYPQTGHSVHWEQPARFVSDLIAFVAAVSEKEIE